MGKYVWNFRTEIHHSLHIVASWIGDSTEKISDLLWKVDWFICLLLWFFFSFFFFCFLQSATARLVVKAAAWPFWDDSRFNLMKILRNSKTLSRYDNHCPNTSAHPWSMWSYFSSRVLSRSSLSSLSEPPQSSPTPGTRRSTAAACMQITARFSMEMQITAIATQTLQGWSRVVKTLIHPTFKKV